MPTSHPLAIRLLGPFEASRTGTDTPIALRRKTRALIAYLATTQQPMHRQSLAALLAMSYGYDVWFQLKVVASVVLGPSAHATMGFAAIPVLVGLLVHLLVAVMLGAGFEIATRRWLRLPSDYGMSAIGGLSFGLLVWLLAYLFVPALAPYLMAIAAPAFIIQHIVYGTVTGVLFGKLWPQPYAAGT